jgi:CubicO group peptidase (beta-lactamase class C family)
MPPETYRSYGERIGFMHNTEGGQAAPLPFWNSECGCALCRPGSNGRGPIRELGRFYEALLAPGWLSRARVEGPFPPVLLKPETIRACATRQRTGLFDHTFQHVVDWGLGFILNSNRYGRETVPYGYGRHCSEETFGHSGSQSSTVFADPAHGLVVAWVFNGMPGERLHQKRAREVNTMIYEDLGLA